MEGLNNCDCWLDNVNCSSTNHYCICGLKLKGSVNYECKSKTHSCICYIDATKCSVGTHRCICKEDISKCKSLTHFCQCIKEEHWYDKSVGQVFLVVNNPTKCLSTIH